MKKLLLVTLSMLLSVAGWSQKTITGGVNDSSGVPLPGAAVVIDGTSNGVVTDFDGNYIIRANEGDILVFSYIGFETQKITVGNSDTIDIVMQQNAAELQEVVVTAYGTQKRESIAGAVSIIKSDQIENSTFSNPVKSLEGLVSGLRVIQSSGQPGSDPIVRIRGFGSINADNSPLIVLDGVPYSGSLNAINPQDIESTSVLKDANSTSLYGNKASNGVLLITTKKGAKNKDPQISIDSRYGITQRGALDYNVTKTPAEYYETYHSILSNSEFYRSNSNGTPLTIGEARQFASNNLIDRLGYNLYDVADTNLVDPSTGKLNPAANLLVNDRWEDALFRDNANFSSTNVNISGGAEKVDYYFSIGTEENNGYTVQSNFGRQSARLKVNATEIADVISLGGDVSYSKSSSQFVPLDGGTSYNNAFQWTRNIAPIYPVYQYDENWNPILSNISNSGFAYDMGSFQSFPNGTTRGARNYGQGEHPLAHIEQSEVTNETDNFNTALRAKIDLPFGIKFEYILNYLTEIDKETYFNKPGSSVGATSLNGTLENGRNNFSVLTNQQLLTWNKEYNRHSYDVLLGHETYVEKFTTLSLYKTNIIGTLSPILDNTAVYNSASNYNTKYTTEGYFSRFIYGFDNKYYVNLTGRYDASSVFHPDERWGAFWSAGASWIMTNEKFFSDLKFLNYAKLASNYGTSGNDRIFYPGTGTRNLVAYENQYVIDENNGALTQSLLSLGGREITWEKSSSFGVNLEMRLFNSVNLGLGYYSRTSNDLLFDKPLQPSTGQNSRPENFGSMKNSGVEAEIAWTAVEKEKLKIVLNANLSTLKNEITELPRDSIQVGNFRRVVGRSAYDYFMVESAGVNPENGNAVYLTTDSNGERVETEDYSEAVTNGRVFLDKAAVPKVNGGFGLNIQFGGFDLGAQFAYQIGGYGLDNVYFGLLGLGTEIENVPDYSQTWTINNPTASLPRVDPLVVDQYRNSDLRLTSLGYLSLANVNFGYTFDNEILDKYNITGIRLYGIINNAALLYTARQGYDPRLNSLGASSGEYGANRTLAVGVNIKLR
ncbi:SusC/RagA family TonB-linked outer membrane protein [Flavobacteriaceae bacterium]|nr:SusC/RagA family TonB-linked outer membrane protein [Flavobacteriaceae bacterium]MDC1364212.1 SusC/RagA family TonB-linked outer membrane protein [Flavobacteriaceae bacterium]